MRRSPELLPVVVLLAACSEVPAPPAAKRFDGPIAAQAITLPEAPARFTGSDGELLNANCLACHSPEMIAYQPAMTREQWAATVKKMREVYKAPIAAGDDERLVTALLALQTR